MKIEVGKRSSWIPINLVIESEEEFMLLLRLYGATCGYTHDSFHDATEAYRNLKSIAIERNITVDDYSKYVSLSLNKGN